MGVCWCWVDRVCRHSYPQITLCWAAGRQRGCRGMNSSSARPCVPLIDSVHLQPSEQLFLALHCISQGFSHPCMDSIVHLLLIPFILLLCRFPSQVLIPRIRVTSAETTFSHFPPVSSRLCFPTKMWFYSTNHFEPVTSMRQSVIR